MLLPVFGETSFVPFVETSTFPCNSPPLILQELEFVLVHARFDFCESTTFSGEAVNEPMVGSPVIIFTVAEADTGAPVFP